jgi:hypothetical protein
VIFTKQDKCGETYLRSSSFPSAQISEKWGQGKRISSVTYGGGQWVVVMTQKQDDFVNDWWWARPNLPTAEIAEGWKEKRVITQVVFYAGLWVLIMSKYTTPDAAEADRTSSTFPESCIRELWG